MKFDVDGSQVYAATGGVEFDAAEPVVIFIHGAGMDHSGWQLQSRWFAWHGRSVLAVDLPGHGLSEGDPLTTMSEMASWTGRVMDACGVETATLVGHSMGAAVALEAAALLGSRVNKLVMIGLATSFPVNPDLLSAAEANDPSAWEMMTAWGHGPAAKLGSNTVPGIWMMGAARALLARNDPGVLHLDLNACNIWKTGPAAAEKVKAPTVMIMGAKDIMTPARGGRALADLVSDCRQIVIPDCGHMMMQEAPDAVLDALIESI